MVQRGRNLVRHSFKDGSRGRATAPAAKAPPAQNASGGVDTDDEPVDGEDFREPKIPTNLPIMMSESDFDDIRNNDQNFVDFEVVLIESSPINDDNTLLPSNVDRDLVQTAFPGMDVNSSNELADVMINTGGIIATPGMPKPNAIVGIGLAKAGDIIKSINSGDYKGAVYDASPILALGEDEQSGSLDRFVRTLGFVGSLASGDFGGAKDIMSSPSSEAEERKPSEHIEVIGDSFEKYGTDLGTGLETGFSNLDKVGQGFKTFGNLFKAASKFENQSEMVRSLPGVRKIEEDRYYTVFFYPRKGITYIEWKPTEDARNLLSKRRFKSAIREWSEDFIAAAGFKLPAWSKRVRYIRDKYGPESDNVKHFGYSRGGGLATHLGGTGFGTGYFSSYQPARKSKSKFSGDFLHDAVINPMSYMLLVRKRMSPF